MPKNENRPGYKKTKAGWIPEEWGCVAFGDVFQIQLGKMLNRKARHGDCQQPYLANVNVRWGSIDLSRVRTMAFSDKEKQKFALQYNDLLVCEGGEIGRCAIWHEEIKPCFYQKALHRLSPKERNIDTSFAMSYLQNAVTSPRMRGLIGETSIAHFTRERFITFPILLPPLPEQEAIAWVLECWDKAIRHYEKKIEKKRNIKKGLMQRLLSGRQRLPGFSGEWKKIAFEEVFTFLKTYAFSREQLTLEPQESIGIYNIHYGDIHATYTAYVLDLEKERSVPLLKKATEIPSNPVLLQEGDLIIADASEDYEGVGACVELRNIGSRKVTGGLHTFVARDKKGYSALGYRSFLLKHPAFAKRMKQISTGVSVHGISKGNLSKENISLPPLHEQKAIASVLSAADSEIEALERKLAQLKDQKKFLLNNLVTGTIRLPRFRGGTINTGADGDHA